MPKSVAQLAETPGAGTFDRHTWQMQLRTSVALTQAIKILRLTEAATASERPKIARAILVAALCQYPDTRTTVFEVLEALLEPELSREL